MTHDFGLAQSIAGAYIARMKRCFSPLFTRLVIVFVVACGLTGGSFAHRFAVPDVDESLLAYIAAGGALDSLCAQTGSAHHSGSCDACRLVDGAFIPSVATHRDFGFDASLLGGPRESVFVPRSKTAHANCPVRAPPFV